MSTLYLNVNVYPLGAGQTAKIQGDIWLASNFYAPPVGSSQPPQGATPAGTIPLTTISFGGTAVSITGLNNAVPYWLRLFSPQGYTHWFPVTWQVGNSSGSPQFVSVPALEGPVALGGFLTGLTSADGSVTIAHPNGPVPDLSVAKSSLPSAGISFTPWATGAPSNIALHTGRDLYRILTGGNAGKVYGLLSGAAPQLDYAAGFAGQMVVWINDQLEVPTSPLAYNIRYLVSKPGTSDYMEAITDTDSINSTAQINPLWAASAFGSSGATFSYTGGRGNTPITAGAGFYNVIWRVIFGPSPY